VGQNCPTFTKIGTKLSQKLKYKNQIEDEEMTPNVQWHVANFLFF